MNPVTSAIEQLMNERDAEKARADSLQSERDESNRMLLKATEDFKGMMALAQKAESALAAAQARIRELEENDAYMVRTAGEKGVTWDEWGHAQSRFEKIVREVCDNEIAPAGQPDWRYLFSLVRDEILRRMREKPLEGATGERAVRVDRAEQERRAGGPAYIREEVCAERIANIVREMDDAYAALAAAQARIGELERFARFASKSGHVLVAKGLGVDNPHAPLCVACAADVALRKAAPSPPERKPAKREPGE